uniref:Uncharacterized protein n=1 Tax=Salvator merianae TaxID=96440 RepID=A0A8D0BMW7_SALMN
MSQAPWYKERLPSKYFQERVINKERFSDALNSQRWRFLKSGLDDFRNGYPPPSDSSIIHGKTGPVPVILRFKKQEPSQIVPYKAREPQIKSDDIFSKLSPAQKAKKDFVARVEHGLVQHPLALYPHLEDSVPPELLCDVARLLDFERQLARGPSGYSTTEASLPKILHDKYKIKAETSYSSALQPWMTKRKNPYTWFSKKEVAERETAAQIAYVAPLDENVKRVTKEFCEWVNAMGGENYNIDEETIMKLFSTRYETSVKAAAPMKTVELYHVPGELKVCLGNIPVKSIIQVQGPPSEPKLEKYKYGAWYLHPKKWKKKKVGEREKIPECLQTFLNIRKKIIQKDEEDAKPLHGTYAFERFLERKGYKKPEFLLQMLAASSPEKAMEENGSSRRVSQNIFEELRLPSSSIF